MPKQVKNKSTTVKKYESESSDMEGLKNDIMNAELKRRGEKPNNAILRTFNLNETLDRAFTDLKRNFKTEAADSRLIKLANEISKEIDSTNSHAFNAEEIDKQVPFDFHSLLLVNNDADKMAISNFSKKIHEEEKTLKEIMEQFK